MAAILLPGVACSAPREAGNAGNVPNNAAATNAAPVVDTGEQAYGRAAMRLQIKYTPERTVTASGSGDPASAMKRSTIAGFRAGSAQFSIRAASIIRNILLSC